MTREEIPLSTRPLGEDQRRVEDEFAHHIAERFEECVQRYCELPESQGGRILDVDLARELCAAYAMDAACRRAYSEATHEPASFFIKQLYARLLETPPDGLRIVLFLAGGAGSGKGTALGRVFQEGSDPGGTYAIIYDSTLAGWDSAADRIQRALDLTWAVEVMYVHRPLDLAAAGVFRRALGGGRIVPLDQIVAGHLGAQETFFGLRERFEGQADVDFSVWNNSGTPEEADGTDVDFLASNRYYDPEHARSEAEAGLNVAYDPYRDDQSNPEPHRVYRAIQGGAGAGAP